MLGALDEVCMSLRSVESPSSTLPEDVPVQLTHTYTHTRARAPRKHAGKRKEPWGPMRAEAREQIFFLSTSPRNTSSH